MTDFKSVKRGSFANKARLEETRNNFTKENAGEMQARGTVVRLENKVRREKLIQAGKDFLLIKDQLPKLQAIDVIHMAMVSALEKENFEDAARYASMMAEYQTPKLARVETTNINLVQDMTDEELRVLVGDVAAA